ncbi:1-acyl-sn-glycerol-3-phosphate acyltransferase [Phormidium pseudopriestleyi FRX01]|uniref:1-acyl-sn-glycerol-3-phosphate acyltransferase n=1 Tax=Phormidium pseudopriestleyi FRX01 TaxID=1759528 RepID=A0ABS3FPG6_9CYAN|nr:lysophospholipid acyltransferase family protein [Phormidium pseudopriestleyi]MBO0348506.1 1-acyl-sn-glycerol-3-phosphate acyltransferase [Phormidium pseudopriestleyi FRX01]
MSSEDRPLQISHGFLTAFGTRTFIYYRDRIPSEGAALIVSNHRSFMDAPLLMVGTGRSIHFACHHYMGQVPLLREFVTELGCLVLESYGPQQHRFFRQGSKLLQQQAAIGVFPEGATPMLRLTPPSEVGEFHRGFAHLALSAKVSELAIVPVAIASMEEQVLSGLPIRMLSLFDPTESHFQQDGFHPLVIYRRVNLLVGRPYWITQAQKQGYPGKSGKRVVKEITDRCREEIAGLLRQGCY